MASTGIFKGRQLSNQVVSALRANSTISALVVHSVDQDGNYVSPGAGSTQVSIRDILTSSGASIMDSTNNAIGVTIRAGSAAGTEYTDGDVDATVSGGAILFDNSSNTLRPVTITRGLPVNVVAGTISASTIVTVSTGSVRVHQSTAADLNVTVAGYSTTANVSSVAGIVTVRPSDTNFASSAGFHFDSSGALLMKEQAPSTGPFAISSIGGVVAISTGPFVISSVGGVIDTELPAPAALADATANPTLPSVGVFGHVYNGTNWSRMRGDAAGVTVKGNVSHDAVSATATPPVMVGGQASAAAPTAVSADGDGVTAWFDRNGALAVQITSAGVLIPGDATNGLDVDVTRISGTVNVSTGPVAISSIAGVSIVRPETGSTWAVRPLQSSQADLRVTVYQSTAADLFVSPVVPTTIQNNRQIVATAGTRVVLSSVSYAAKAVTVKALSINTGFIYVGNSSVASTSGFELTAGESISLDIAQSTQVYIDASVSGEGVTWILVN